MDHNQTRYPEENQTPATLSNDDIAPVLTRLPDSNPQRPAANNNHHLLDIPSLVSSTGSSVASMGQTHPTHVDLVDAPGPQAGSSHTSNTHNAEAEEMPPLIPMIRILEQGVRSTFTRDEDGDDIPDLMSVSDSSSVDEADDRDVEMNLTSMNDGDADVASREWHDTPPLEQAQQPPLPPPIARTGNRRARVEDDDENSARMRPSPRVSRQSSPRRVPIIVQSGTSVNNVNLPSEPTSTNSGHPNRPTRPLPRNGPPPLRPHHHNPLFATSRIGQGPPPFDVRAVFSQMFGAGSELPRQPVNPRPDIHTHTNAPPNHVPPRHFPGVAEGPGFTFTFNIGPGAGMPPIRGEGLGQPPPGLMDFTIVPPPTGLNQNQTPTQAQGQREGHPIMEDLFRNMFANLPAAFSFGRENEREDPERATKLIAGLEVVPHGLVRRMERVGGAPGAHQDDTSGTEAGCAVCWDQLLDPEGDGFKVPTVQNQNVDALDNQSEQVPDNADPSLTDVSGTPPSASTLDQQQSNSEEPKIVVLPCAHVFHTSCLNPWFSRPRQTTCPTCRFNIDPENLTYVYRPPPRPNGVAGQGSGTPLMRTNPPGPATRQGSPDVLGPPQEARPDVGIANGAAPGEPTVQQNGQWTAFNVGPIPDRHVHPHPGLLGHDVQQHVLTMNFDFVVAEGAEGIDGGGDGGDNEPGPAPQGPPPEVPQEALAFLNQLFGAHLPRSGPASAGQLRQKKEWTPPPPSGLTLRQRVEKKEREAGLRCWDVSCGVGPTDDDPFPIALPSMKQTAIRSLTNSTLLASKVCEHTFHPACLVSAERVAGWGAGDGLRPHVEVACPVCRAVGVVDRAEWDEGVQALA